MCHLGHRYLSGYGGQSRAGEESPTRALEQPITAQDFYRSSQIYLSPGPPVALVIVSRRNDIFVRDAPLFCFGGGRGARVEMGNFQKYVQGESWEKKSSKCFINSTQLLSLNTVKKKQNKHHELHCLPKKYVRPRSEENFQTPQNCTTPLSKNNGPSLLSLGTRTFTYLTGTCAI